jgi:prepilin-type N-terminal cleavage/methylation domain-containing protein
MKKAFSLIEVVCAVVIVGVITSLSIATYTAVVNGWTTSTEYMDKMQRSDYALEQIVTGLRSMHYPHDGKQHYEYGFFLEDNGEGNNPDNSDVIEWSKTGSAVIGNKSSAVDSVHRVRVMVLEEGNSDYGEKIEVTGLYARISPDSALRPKDDEIDYTFGNSEMYAPILIVDGVVGMNCRVLKNAEGVDASNDKREFEDKWDTSNSVPYKVELTFHIADPEGKSYRSNTAPLMRIVRIPIHEQSLDGAIVPGNDAAPDPGASKGGVSSGGRPGGRPGGGLQIGPGGGGPIR